MTVPGPQVAKRGCCTFLTEHVVAVSGASDFETKRGGGEFGSVWAISERIVVVTVPQVAEQFVARFVAVKRRG